MAGGAGIEVGAGVTLVYGFKPIVGNGAGELVRIAVLVGGTGDGWLEWAELVWVRRSLAPKQLRLRSMQGEITAIANAANKSEGTVVPHLRTAVVSVSPRKTASIL